MIMILVALYFLHQVIKTEGGYCGDLFFPGLRFCISIRLDICFFISRRECLAD